MTTPTPGRSVVLVCPCCASAVDATTAAQEQNLDCAACGQHWRMVVEAERIAEYALT